MDTIIRLNRWIQVYDLECAKAAAFDYKVPEWYHAKAEEWKRERDEALHQEETVNVA